MNDIKGLKQTEYDDYLTLELIPDFIEEFGKVDTIILKRKKIRFAKTCPFCGDLIILGKDYDLCQDLIDMETETTRKYIEMVTDLEVVNQDDCLECECYESDMVDDDPEAEIPQEEFESEEDTEIDLDEDYGDGNYE